MVLLEEILVEMAVVVVTVMVVEASSLSGLSHLHFSSFPLPLLEELRQNLRIVSAQGWIGEYETGGGGTSRERHSRHTSTIAEKRISDK